MNIKGITNAITKTATKGMTQLKVKSPTILVVGGTLGALAAGVIACIETHKKLDGIIAEHKEKVAALKDIRDGVVVLDEYTTEEYAANHYKKHLFHVYLSTICKLGKCYLPAFLLATASVISIFKGFGTLNERYLKAVARALFAERGWAEYRKRVADQFGEEAEKLVYLGGEKAVIKDREIDPATGEVKETLKEAIVGPDTGLSWTYIVSKETVNDALYGISDGDFRHRLGQLVNVGNQYFTRHDQISLQTLMAHWWLDDYMRKHPETISNGWLYNDQFVAEGRDIEEAIKYEVKVLDSDPDNRKYAVTFNVQCNIVDSLALENKEKREARRMKRKVQGKIRPAVA